MEQEETSGTKNASPRKVRFKPKAPPRARTPNLVQAKTEVVDEDDEASQTRELLRRISGLGRRRPQVEKKSTQVEVIFGGSAPTSIRTYGVPVDRCSSSSSTTTTTTNTSKTEPQCPVSDVGANVSPQRLKNEYTKPWNYDSYYPITLPLRKPNSGDPELLDKAEFGEASANLEYDENSINPAAELGLMEENGKAKMFFLQLPPSLPLVKRSATVKGKEMAESSKPSSSVGHAEKGCSLNELPAGFMGKMLIYRNGAMKLKLGETLYDVSPGSDCSFAQDVAAINTKDKQCCILGELNKRVIVTPDIDTVLDSVIDMD